MFEFLEVEDVHGVHEECLRRYGVATGERELGLLDSSLAAALDTLLYTRGDEFHIAAAYAFQLGKSQCFFDGNKRTSIGAASLLNKIAGSGAGVIEERLYDAMVATATHELDKAGLARLFREIF
jgi:death on curing protein